MGLFDDVSSLVGKSIDAADKKAQQLKIQTQLTHIDGKKGEALSELGRVVLLDMKSDPRFLSLYADQIGAITQLENEAEVLREKLEALQSGRATLVSSGELQAALAEAPTVACPQCGARVNLTDSFCSSCGKDVASIKLNTRKCVPCGRVYDAGVAFCELCGKPTLPYEATEDAPECESSERANEEESASAHEGAPESAAQRETSAEEETHALVDGSVHAEEASEQDVRCAEDEPKQDVRCAEDEPKRDARCDEEAPKKDMRCDEESQPRCSSCGNPAIPNARFCGYCGAPLARE